jgi:hypothetical protein
MWVSPCMKRKIVRELLETSEVMHNFILGTTPGTTATFCCLCCSEVSTH